MNIFISHNSADKKIAVEIVNLLHVGMNIDKQNIFCSSADGTDVPIGADFQKYIKDKLKDSGLVLPIITKNYYQSIFSMYELGAAWANSVTTIPILVGMNFDDLRHFLSTIISVRAENQNDLNRLYDRLVQLFSLRPSAVTWEQQREIFIKSIREHKNTESTTRSFPPALNLKPTRSKYKLVAFDLDGTLLQGKDFKYSWKAIWNYLGYDDSIREKLYNKHMANPTEYSYEDWCKECGKYFKEKGLKREDIKTIIRANKIKQAPTLESTLKVLRQQNIYTAVISGGVDTFYEFGISTNVQRLIDRVYINKFIYDHEEKLINVTPQPGMESDFSGKIQILEKMCSELNCNVDQAVFVGEGYNDKEIGGSPCLAIAYPCHRAHPEFRAVANHKVYERSISAILPLILVEE